MLDVSAYSLTAIRMTGSWPSRQMLLNRSQSGRGWEDGWGEEMFMLLSYQPGGEWTTPRWGIFLVSMFTQAHLLAQIEKNERMAKG